MKKVGEQLALFDKPAARDPWRNHPDNWLANADDAGPIVYHASNDKKLPARDDSSRGAQYAGDHLGMHFGTEQAARDRSEHTRKREWLHTARIANEDISGTRMSDTDANHSRGSVVVEHGKAVAYTNDTEDPGSTSYRALPQTVSTWGETVSRDKFAHPALNHLAERGYNPAINLAEERESHWAAPIQMNLFGGHAPVQEDQFKPTLHKTGLRF